jgi:hypothetical protein
MIDEQSPYIVVIPECAVSPVDLHRRDLRIAVVCKFIRAGWDSACPFGWKVDSVDQWAAWWVSAAGRNRSP